VETNTEVNVIAWVSEQLNLLDDDLDWQPDVARAFGQIAPDFIFKHAHGRDIRLSAYQGKLVLLNFWATWCHGCKLEIPWLMDFQSRYEGRGFAVIGVSLDDGGWKVIRPFVSEKKMNYPVVLGDDDLTK
jgi:peroxiredoxin